jgi:isopenicillin-N epimerase
VGLEYGAGLRSHFLLERDIVFLNHGSFGATPRAVMAAQRRWQRRMEAEPVRFMTRELGHALPEAGAALARFLGAAPGDLVFVENATAGVNAVLRSFPLGPGDEVLITGEVYPAVLKTLRHIAERGGARIVEAPLDLPFTDEAAILSDVAARLSPRTRLLVLDLITSRSAAILPVAALARLARDAGARVLIDAAHGPGQIDLDLPGLGADWVAGNVHKWLFAPKGTGFLWAAPGAQAGLHPTVISHGYGEGFQAEFGWTGTRDPSAWLSVPAAIDFYRRHGDGALRVRNRDLAAEAAALLAAALDAEVSAPAAMRAAMAALALPARLGGEPAVAASLHDRLLDRHRIEVPVFAHAGRLWLRVSAQIYNERADYERLAEAAAREMA